MNILNTWAETWLFKFNPHKTEFVVFSNNKNIDHVNIRLNCENIKQVEDHSDLGVCLSSTFVTVNGVIILTTHAKRRQNEYTFTNT